MAGWIETFKLRDDRGVPLTQVERFDKRDGLWHDRKKPWRASPWIVWNYALTGVALWWWFSHGQGVWLPSAPELLILAGLFVVQILVMRWWSRRPDSWMRRMVWGPIAWLCTYRVCGVCGYGLGEIEPAADGIAVCPECGAGWHRDRWVMEGQNPRENDDLVGLIEGKPFGKVSVSAVDHRGVPMVPSHSWYPRWVKEDGVSAAERVQVREHLRKVGVGFLIIASAASVPIWIGTVVLTVWLEDPLPRDLMESVIITSIGAGLVYLVLFLIAMRSAVAEERLQRASLGVGRCPNCGERIGSGVVGFDGCEDCSRCRRAWKRAEIGKPMAASSPGDALGQAS